MKKFFLALFLAGLVISIAGTSDVCATSELDIMNKLKELSKSVERQQEEIRYLRQQLEEQKVATEKAREKDVAEIKKTVSKELKEEAKLPKWTKKIKVGADARVRYEGIWNRNKAGNEKEDRNRGRLRARLYFDTDISDEVSAHIALCTNYDVGTNFKAKTSNSDMTDYFNTKNIGLIRVYGEYKPKWLQGFKVGAGKYKKNFLHTDITWDPDANPEGVYGYYKYSGLDIFQPFLYGSWNIIDEQKDGADPRLTIIQPGFDLKFGDVTWTLAGSYYNYENLNQGTTRVDGESTTMAEFAAYGNSTDPSDATQYLYGFRLLEGITFLNFKVADIPVNLFFDYIKNTADDVPGENDTAIAAGFKVGKNKKQGDTSLFFKWAKIEPDATLGIFNDSDFYGSNRKGTKTKISYNLLDRLTFNAAIFFTDTVRGDTNEETRGMVDFEAKF